jgi:hypothetical protein
MLQPMFQSHPLDWFLFAAAMKVAKEELEKEEKDQACFISHI